MMINGGIDYAWAERELQGRTVREITCPSCSHTRKAHHRKAPCLGLRLVEDGRITFNCMNCGEAGVVTRRWQVDLQPGSTEKRQPRQPPPQPERYDDDMARWAKRVWDETEDPAGTPLERYWWKRFGDNPVPIPRTVRYHPRLKAGEEEGFFPAMVAAFSLNVPRQVTAIHRTFLKPDGSGHIGVKKAAGNHEGVPCVVHRNAERGGLVIAEGIEKALAAGLALGLEAWAACGATFLPKLAAVVPDSVEFVWVIVDWGQDGSKNGKALMRGLAERGIEHRAVRVI